MSPLLVDLDAAAQALSVSRRTVQGLVYRGEIPSVSVGRRRLIASADLLAYVDRLRAVGQPELHVMGGSRST